MASPPAATLGGVPLAGQVAYEWPLVAGVMPHEARFEVTENVWKQLEPYAGVSEESPGLTYLVTRDGVELQRVERLFIVDVYQGAVDYTRRIRVVDRRWLWKNKHVSSTYNMTWATGETLVFSDGQNAETPDLLPNIQYAKPTLKNETTVWTADEIVKDVLRQVNGEPPRMEATFQATPVDDLELDDPGHFAIERVLAYLPGAEIYLDYSGNAVVKDSRDRSETEVYERLKDLQQGTLGVRVTQRKWSRPARVDVLFTPELDVRFDYEEAPTGTVTEDQPRLYNVGQVTEVSGLEVGGKKLGPGSWAKLTDLFTTWGAGPGKRLGGSPARVMSFDILRKHSLGDFRYLRAEFAINGSPTGAGIPDPQWERRLLAAVTSYRKHFRIARDFMARLASVRPVRASVLSSNTGARASSPVYSDYVMRPSHKGWSQTGNPAHGVAERGYADQLTSSTVKPAPVHVQLLNPSAGVFALVPRQTDTRGYYSAVALGYPDTSSSTEGDNPNYAYGLPQQSLGAVGGSSVVRNKFALLWDCVDLEADWKFSTIMSCVPRSPNDTGRLYKVSVSAADVGENEALGPPVTVRIYPGVVTARFAYTDADRSVIENRILGVGQAWPSQFVNRRHVEDVARAAALRAYELYQDRPFGTMQVDSKLASTQEPVGSIKSVTQAMQGGATVTKINFSQVTSPLDIWRYLPASTRRALLHSQLSLADPLGAALGF